MTDTRNLAASVRARLLNRAKQETVAFDQMLTRYALERMLYRLSVSPHRDQFLLKGALLFDLWFDVPHRPTRDADMLGFGAADLATVAQVFRDICAIAADDGITFAPETVVAQEIRKEANYAGIRVTFMGILSGARCPMQVDIGFGDAVTPGPIETAYPVLLGDFPQPQLRVYPRDTVVAEKLEAIITLGMANSRMKDYFDLWTLSRHAEFSGAILQEAIAATCARRNTPIPAERPLGLDPVFADNPAKRAQWHAFLQKNKLDAPGLPEAINTLSQFLLPLLDAVRAGVPHHGTWLASGPWTVSGSVTDPTRP